MNNPENNWWQNLNRKQLEGYLKDHPDSKYANTIKQSWQEETDWDKIGEELGEKYNILENNIKKHGLDRGSIGHLKKTAKFLRKIEDGSRFQNPKELTKLHNMLEEKLTRKRIKLTSKSRLRRLAKMQFKSALYQIKQTHRYLDYDDIDPGMHSMFISDAADHLEIALNLAEGNIKKASRKVDRMDTASRDHIPGQVWEFLEKNY